MTSSIRKTGVFARHACVVGRAAIGLMAALVAMHGPVSHAQAPSPAAKDDMMDVIMSDSKRPSEFLQILKDKNPATQMAALHYALRDPDPVLRGIAISAYLKRFDALTPEVNVEKDAQIRQEDVPRLALKGLRWSDDGLSFSGDADSYCGSNNRSVLGQIAGGTLAINYSGGVCLSAALRGADVGNDAKKAVEESPIDCQVFLKPNATGDSLEGPLHCRGVSADLPVRLPFGP